MKRATPSPRPRGEQVQERGPHPTALPVVDHGHGRLGGVRAVCAADEAGDADPFARLRVDGRERLVVVVVDVGEVA